ncbi:MAG: molybdenum ABC transporter ATP-binding protein [Beijerinckiaceae bacterium]
MSGAHTINATFRGHIGDFFLDAAFTIPARGVTALFGPSGCGKTSVLRCMAGLQHVPGSLSVTGLCWQESERGIFVPPHRRETGYVFQEASLFPHMNVRSNLLYGARRAGAAHAAALDFDELVDLLRIRPLLERDPLALSGGERQRVAVGRALLSRPRILLMDEPLSALDQITKGELLPYFESLHERLAMPVIYVTHDMREVERLADTLVLMESGRVRACGPLTQLQADPALPLHKAPDAAVVIEGRVAAIDAAYALTVFAIPGGELTASGIEGKAGEAKRLRIAASDVSFTLKRPQDTTILNVLPAVVRSVDTDADQPQALVVAALGGDGNGAQILARITRKSLEALRLAPGAQVFAQIKGVAIASSRSGAAAHESSGNSSLP